MGKCFSNNDVELDRQRVEHGRSGFTGKPVARKEMNSQNMRLCGRPLFVRGLILYTQIDPRLFPDFILTKDMSKTVLVELAEKSAQRMALRGATTLTEALVPRLVLAGEAGAVVEEGEVIGAAGNTFMSGGAAP